MSRAAQFRAAFHRLVDALAVPRPARDIQQIVVEEARRLTAAASAAFCLLADNEELLDFVAASGDNSNQILGLRIRLSDSHSERAVHSGQPLLLDYRGPSPASSLFHGENSGEAEPEPPRAESPASAGSARTAAVVPIHHDGRIIGTLSALNKLPAADGSQSAFDQDDLDTLTLLANVAALGATVDRTARDAREQGRELTVLYDAARSVAGSLDVANVMDSVLAALCRHFEHTIAVVYLLNDERTHLFIAAHNGLNGEEQEMQIAVDSALAGPVLDKLEPRLIPDTEDAFHVDDLPGWQRLRSAMIAPVCSRDEPLGLMILGSSQRGAYDAGDLRLLASVGTQAGIAYENAELYEDEQRHAEQVSALYDLSQHVNATLNLDRVLNFVADSVLSLLNADRFALMLFNKADGQLETRLSRNLDDSFDALRPRIGEGIPGWIFEWQTPQAVADVAADARNRTAPMDEFGVASLLGVPMQVRDETIGVLMALSTRRRLFTVAEMELLYTIANQASVAVVNAMLFRDARNRSHEMRRYFQRMAQAIGSALETENLPQLLADLSAELMSADRCAIYTVEHDTLRLVASSRFRAANPPDASIPAGAGIAGWVARRGQALIVPDLEQEPRRAETPWLTRERLASCLAVPLKSGRRTVGVVEVYTVEPHTFTREEAVLLSTFLKRARITDRLMPAE